MRLSNLGPAIRCPAWLRVRLEEGAGLYEVQLGEGMKASAERFAFLAPNWRRVNGVVSFAVERFGLGLAPSLMTEIPALKTCLRGPSKDMSQRTFC